MASIGTCDQCGKRFEYSLVHNGFNDSAYGYCNRCGCTALFNGYKPVPEGVTMRLHEKIDKHSEAFIAPCSCGGHFTADATPRCPHCSQELSPELAANWIEKDAPGTAKGWRWQRSWNGLYCIIIEGLLANEPWTKDSVFDTDTHLKSRFENER